MCNSYHAIDRQQLVTPLQASLAIGHAPRDHSGNVDGRVLLFAPHDVKTQALVRLRKLDHSWVGVALAGCKSCDRGLVRKAASISVSRSESRKFNKNTIGDSRAAKRALLRYWREGRNMVSRYTSVETRPDRKQSKHNTNKSARNRN